MTYSNVTLDVDVEGCETIMRRYSASTMDDAVNFALRSIGATHFTPEEADRLSGIGWGWEDDDHEPSQDMAQLVE